MTITSAAPGSLRERVVPRGPAASWGPVRDRAPWPAPPRRL